MADQQQSPKDQFQRKKEQNKNQQQGGNQPRGPRGGGDNDPKKNTETAGSR